MRRPSLYKMRHVAKFGSIVSIEDPVTHVNEPSFILLATLHYAKRQRTVVESYQAVNTKYEDTFMIMIRHNRLLSAAKKALVVDIDGELYDVVSYSQADEDYRSYDLLTLKHHDKVGGGKSGN